MNITGSASIEWFEYFELDELDANGAPSLMADGSPSRGDMLRDGVGASVVLLNRG